MNFAGRRVQLIINPIIGCQDTLTYHTEYLTNNENLAIIAEGK